MQPRNAIGVGSPYGIRLGVFALKGGCIGGHHAEPLHPKTHPLQRRHITFEGARRAGVSYDFAHVKVIDGGQRRFGMVAIHRDGLRT